MKNNARPSKPSAEVILSPDALPAHCPGDNSELWCTHPKVYVALSRQDGDKWLCPYCGTRFVMKNP